MKLVSFQCYTKKMQNRAKHPPQITEMHSDLWCPLVERKHEAGGLWDGMVPLSGLWLDLCSVRP